MDGSESSGVKVARGQKIEDVRQRLQGEQELIARLRTANVRFSDAQTERIWAIVSAHQAGLSIRYKKARFLVRQPDGESFSDFGDHFRRALGWPSLRLLSHAC